MYPASSNGLASEMQQNIPSQSLMFTMYSTTFGNYSFMVQPPQPGQSSDQFPSIPYLSLEALLYQQQSSNPQVAPANVQSGPTTGKQVMVGAQLQSDGTGVARQLSGYQASNQQLL
jgi:hypothetical protein